ncbi:hypothetical protein ASG72_03985 [Bosea sp. Leaf344]|uniref:NAD-dependent epimerase/dehydratase family protein n=1 Tax=Bosea sp. Leaf344 TaxID=1736346 RepID=UPI0006F66D9B|nr:NAD(P)-dependent oxidoreductase [Bosea sp. Leaf344]KQU54783.1 hypothetical protein ASG72_03985 [Bosea sp. Leaf344]
MHILITGASGFVGQALVREALSHGHGVTALVRDEAAVPHGAAALVHSLGSGQPLRLPDTIDAVAHLAQSRAYRAFPGDADEMFRVNVAGTHELLDASAKAGVQRFCLVSSGTVYEPFLQPLVETASLQPVSNLGATKFAAEILSRPYSALFPISVLRVFAPYGPNQAERLIPDLIRRIRQGVPVSLPVDGGGMEFAPTYVDDFCQVLLVALRDSWSGIFNVAAPEAHSIEHVATMIGKHLGLAPVFARNLVLPAGTVPPRVVPDLTKLATRFDLSQFRRFEDGLGPTLSGER